MQWIINHTKELHDAIGNLYADSPQTIGIIAVCVVVIALLLLPWGDASGRRHRRYTGGRY